MFTSLDIKNFRGLASLSIEKLSSVNIFLGKNNSGKTSVLECILLLSGHDNGMIAPMLNLVRGGTPESLHRDISYLFHGKEYNNEIIISAIGSSTLHNKTVKIQPQFKEERKIEESIKFEGIKSTTGTSIPTGLKYQVKFEAKQMRAESISADFLSAFRPDASTLTNYTNIVKAGVKHELISLLKLFDPRIEGVELIDKEIFIRLEGFNELLPLNFAGDGLKRFFSIWSAVNNPDNEVVLIDEIDNGIHHTSYPLLWQTLLESAVANNTQLFITTHSDESLTALKAVVDEDKHSDRLSIYSLARSERKGLRAYHYSYKNMLSAIESRIELRD